jgi:predicted PurR-regulated permease PerM
MSDDTRANRLGYGALLVAALLLTALVLVDIWKPLLLATVLAAGLGRYHERLATAMHQRRSLSALVLTVAVLLFVLVPLVLLVLYLITEAIDLVHQLREIVRRSGPAGLVTALPDRIESLVRSVLRYLQTDMNEIGERVRGGGLRAVLSVRGLLQALGDLVFQLGLMMIALFFFLREGPRIAGWLRWAYPLRPGELDTLMRDFRLVARNVIGATVLTAAIQATLATIGYTIAGVPAPILFGALTLFAAFIPAVGTPVVGVPLAVFQFFFGRPWQGIFLAAWALGLVGTVDNVLRPILMKGGGGMRLHGTVLFFALVGGLTFFGPIGLVMGPLGVVLLDSVIQLRRPPQAPPS